MSPGSRRGSTTLRCARAAFSCRTNSAAPARSTCVRQRDGRCLAKRPTDEFVDRARGMRTRACPGASKGCDILRGRVASASAGWAGRAEPVVKNKVARRASRQTQGGTDWCRAWRSYMLAPLDMAARPPNARPSTATSNGAVLSASPAPAVCRVRRAAAGRRRRGGAAAENIS